ncbi:MAG: diguanylate cyclase [Desulfovibrionaceae bacterium]
MSRWTDPPNTSRSNGHTPRSGLFLRLGIRSSLLLGFGAIIGVMALSVLAALYFSARVDTVVSDILAYKLPTTVRIFRVARAADALAASGLSLASLSTKEARDEAFKRIDDATESLNSALGALKTVVGDGDTIPTDLFAELEDNLRRLQAIVDARITLREQQLVARKRLFANLLIFQRHLIYRTRILEGDGDVISRLMAQPDPPVGKVAAMAVQLTPLLPMARFYATVESIHGRLLAASLTPSLASLNTSRHELAVSLATLRDALAKLPEDPGRDLAQPVEDLDALTLRNDGLIQLRENELRLLGRIMDLNAVNQGILQRVNTATSRMVDSSQREMSQTGRTLTRIRQRATVILVLLAGLGLLCVAGLMHFYVNRQVIARLSWLSASMQDVAAGRLDTNLPPAGSSELGRLGAALQQFRDTAAEARDREKALQDSNQRARQAMEALEEKTAELERANSQLTELSIRDPLTGLFNRRRFDETLELEWARAGHGGKAVALIILDVDHFKAYNDRYGHQLGDECLKKLAAVLTQYARRAGDVAARYGGEEFCMICPYTDMGKADVLAESIRKAVCDLALPHEDSPFGVVTVSLGYAAGVPGEKCASPEELLHIADAALYAAKAGGRNRVHGEDSSCGKAPASPCD